MKKFLYQCPTKPKLIGWFPDMNRFRQHFSTKLQPNDVIIRVAHVGVEPPKGWHKPNGHLAHNPIEMLPTLPSSKSIA